MESLHDSLAIDEGEETQEYDSETDSFEVDDFPPGTNLRTLYLREKRNLAGARAALTSARRELEQLREQNLDLKKNLSVLQLMPNSCELTHCTRILLRRVIELLDLFDLERTYRSKTSTLSFPAVEFRDPQTCSLCKKKIQTYDLVFPSECRCSWVHNNCHTKKVKEYFINCLTIDNLKYEDCNGFFECETCYVETNCSVFQDCYQVRPRSIRVEGFPPKRTKTSCHHSDEEDSKNKD
jgi:hypothetical protein